MTTATKPRQRMDIQGLRALAVGIVVVYHLKPELLPGGFVGVDVFFVISGFLIIGSLVREASRDHRIDFAGFYARRLRRLFPAAAVLLVGVIAGTVLVLPQSRWQDVSTDVLYSVLQVQNWHQAWSSTSYAGATAAVSPLQHFWSLAVEEQFYLAVPLLLWAVLRISRGRRWSVLRSATLALALIAIASLAYSVYLSSMDHTTAYFATTTRMWELAAGGLAALIPQRRLEGLPAWSFAVTWVGFGAVLLSAKLLSTDMQFPGYIAAIPVLGAVLLLRAGGGAPTSVWTPSRWLTLKPVVLLGDISYSLYLWHWPLIVFAVAVLGRGLRIREAIVLAVLSLLLALASYFLVEQRFRRPRPVRSRGFSRYLGPYRFAATMSVVICLAAWGPWQVIESKRAELEAGLSNHDYPGAMAWRDGAEPAPAGVAIRPDPAIASQDVPVTYTTDCGVYDPRTIPDTQCWYGAAKDTAARTVAIVGDSHAGQYVDSLVEVSKHLPLRIHAMVRNGCPFSTTPPRSTDTVFSNCSEQNRATLGKLLRDRPDIVVLAGMTSMGYQKALGWTWGSGGSLQAGYVDVLTTLRNAGVHVYVLADTPYPPDNPPECLQRNPNDYTRCAFPDAAPTDDLVSAARQVTGVQVIDLHGYFCRAGTCPAVIGNIVVYRDNHMTSTFAKSLAGILVDRLGVLS